MSDSYELSKLSPESFENLVNFLAMKTLGSGVTGFGPGADGGRDGYFSGAAPYPSATDNWKGTWYIQSKFHKPHLSTNPQSWLREQAQAEIELFERDDSDRIWPDIWILATNIDPSGTPETGSFDAIQKRLNRTAKGRKVKLAIWGGRKILDLLAAFPAVAEYYGHYLTPGHVLFELHRELAQSRASGEEILRYFIVTQFDEHKFTKLDQAGSSTDIRPAVHDLFIDLPYVSDTGESGIDLLAELSKAAAQSQKYSSRSSYPGTWKNWQSQLKRARVSLIKGGPGQGKSTIGQYLCQIHRASLILGENGPQVNGTTRENAVAVRTVAMKQGLWTEAGRVPIQIELKEYTHWYSQRGQQVKGLLPYLANVIEQRLGVQVQPKTLKTALSFGAWIIIFDGLDEVPNDYKDKIAHEVIYFLNDFLVEIDADVLSVCTSRPQGYSGQFSGIDGPIVDLGLLPIEVALECSKKLLQFNRTDQEALQSMEVLQAASLSPNIRELMTTPLQSHIMAVIVRDGGRPPERRWQLFNSFYQVMKKREAQKNFPNQRIATLLREGDRLLMAVHMRLGFVLHARAETSEGAQTTLNRQEFKELVRDVVTRLEEGDVEQTVDDLMEATTERLVLVSTPESGQQVRFEIRQLQEFFAAEFLYSEVAPDELARRIEAIGGDAHWREVMHFLLSALVENIRATDISVAVQVLRTINEGSADVTSTLSRRMARASFLAARLLTEGVLEQGKADRQQLKPLFEPLTGILDLTNLLFLLRIRPNRSRAWFIQQLIEKVGSASPKEYVGALLLLGWMLPTSESSETMKDAFYRLSHELQEELIAAWCPAGYQRFGNSAEKVDLPLCNWVIEIAVTGLNSEFWFNLTAISISSLISICVASQKRFISACHVNGIDEQTANDILLLLMNEEPFSQKGLSTSFGLIKGFHFKDDWRTGTIPTKLKRVRADAVLLNTNGVFRLLATCLRFAQSRSYEATRDLVALWEKCNLDVVHVLPTATLALVPLHGRGTINAFSLAIIDKPLDQIDLIELLKNQGAEDLVPLCSTLIIDRPKNVLAEREKCWSLFAQRLPFFALDFAFDRAFSTAVPVCVPELVTLMKEYPERALTHILAWGSLENAEWGHMLEFLRNFAVNSQTQVSFKISRLSSALSTFALRLPEEIPILAHLGPALRSFFSNQKGNRRVDRIEETLRDYGISMELLRAVMLDVQHAKVVRAGAACLFWQCYIAHQNTNSRSPSLDLDEEFLLYSSLSKIPDNSSLSTAFVEWLLSAYSESDPKANRIAALLVSENDVLLREQLVSLIRTWRERSSAPVNTKNLIDSWLSYKFAPVSIDLPDLNRR